MTTPSLHGRHQRRATLLALLLLAPLVHGAGAHLAEMAAGGLGVAAPVHDADPHASDEPCELCLAGRGSLDRLTVAAWSTPVVAPAEAQHGPHGLLRASPDRVRPDAPRAPPALSA